MDTYNLIQDYSLSDAGQEPLEVNEVKDYLRLEGFIDDSESLCTEFDDDDELIAQLISSARERLEKWTGLSFVPRTAVVELTNLSGNITLPFGPVTDVTSVKDSGGSELAFSTSLSKRKLRTPMSRDIRVEYDCGYQTLPAALKEAMLKEVAYRFTNRGDENVTAASTEALALASPFKEVHTWL